MRILMTILFSLMMSSLAFAHPSEADSISVLPDGFQLTFQTDVNVPPRTDTIALDKNEDCSFRYYMSGYERVISRGTTFNYQRYNRRPEQAKLYFTNSNSGRSEFHLDCHPKYSISELRRALKKLGIELIFPAPIPF